MRIIGLTLKGFLVPLILLAVTVVAQQQKPTDEKASKQIKSTIENYIRNDVEIKGGFLLPDPKEGKLLNLSFDELHKSVGYGEDESPFVCADFRDEQGKKYDVDVYVKKVDGNWRVNRVIIHKVDGEARR